MAWNWPREKHSRQKVEQDMEAGGSVQATPPWAWFPHGKQGWGQGSARWCPGTEHRQVIITTTTAVTVSTLRGGGCATPALWGWGLVGRAEAWKGAVLAGLGLLSHWPWAVGGRVGVQCCQERDPGLWVAHGGQIRPR